MSVIKGVLNEELTRLERMERSYKAKLKTLPKGVLRLKTIKGKQYYYLRYRDNQTGKVVDKYIPASQVAQIQANLERAKAYREKLKNNIKNIKEDRQLIFKAFAKRAKKK